MNPFRETCYRCHRPKAHCLCHLISQVDNRTSVLVLQHKCERSHPFGTARFVRLGLKRAQVRLVFPNAQRRFAVEPCALQRAGLLYPGQGAIDLATVPETARPEQLVVLDGTWDDAKQLYQDNAWLCDLPHYCLHPASPSIYRLRREPSEKSVSTLEAIVLALSILEPQTEGLSSLLSAFNAMIELQLSCLNDNVGKESTKRTKKPRQRLVAAVPAPILERMGDLVVAYGESVPWRKKRRALVSLTAVRLGDGEPFEQFLMPPPEATLADDHLQIMGLSRQHWNNAVDHEELRRLWQRYSRPSDVLVCWNASTLALLRAALGAESLGLFLKAPYCNLMGKKCGHLQDLAKEHDFELERLPLTGRSALRVAQVIEVARLLNSRVCGHFVNDGSAFSVSPLQKRGCNPPRLMR
ncbi:MAG: DTW domain-containing protein [Myxococcota bacterium]|nr:DTW domain-containing protein [Myxococcota bacterium]